LARVVASFDEIMSSADSVSLFTGWRGPMFEQVWLKRRVGAGDHFEPPLKMLGATIATVPLHPIPGMSTAALTEQLGVPGPWLDRLPHFRLDHTPSNGDELQSEYLLPRRHAADALLAIDRIRDRFAHLVQTSEVRTVAPDALWMSTASGRASVAIHFTWQPAWDAVRDVLPSIEDALAPFAPRPHWGKVFTMRPEAVRSTYERLGSFTDLIDQHDPEGKFRNPFVDRYVPRRDVGPARA
jgi:xylitol oxidase